MGEVTYRLSLVSNLFDTAIDAIPRRPFSSHEIVPLQLVEIVPDRSIGFRVLDTLAVFLIEVSRRNLPVILDHVVNFSLVGSEGVNVLLA
jgi:hypothetical protein